MTEAAIAADLHQALDVHGNLTAKVTFNLEILVDVVTQLTDIFFGQILNAHIGVDAGGVDDLVCGGTADAVDIRQGDFNAFFPGKVDTRNSCHGRMHLQLSYGGMFDDWRHQTEYMNTLRKTRLIPHVISIDTQKDGASAAPKLIQT